MTSLVLGLYLVGAFLQLAGLGAAWFRLRTDKRRIQGRDELRRTLEERHAAEDADAKRTFLRQHGPTGHPSKASATWDQSPEAQALRDRHRREFEDAGLPVVTLESWEKAVSRGDDSTLELLVIQELSGFWPQALAVALGTVVGLVASVLAVCCLPVD